MDQVPLFEQRKPVVIDPSESRRVTDAAIDAGERGLAAPAKEAWVAAAMRVVARGKAFTTDDVWKEIGHTYASHDYASGMGSVMRLLSQSGIIRWTGEVAYSSRPEQHRKPLKLWKPA